MFCYFGAKFHHDDRFDYFFFGVMLSIWFVHTWLCLRRVLGIHCPEAESIIEIRLGFEIRHFTYKESEATLEPTTINQIL